MEKQLTFEQIKEGILSFKANSQNKQASIVIVRGVFDSIPAPVPPLNKGEKTCEGDSIQKAITEELAVYWEMSEAKDKEIQRLKTALITSEEEERSDQAFEALHADNRILCAKLSEKTNEVEALCRELSAARGLLEAAFYSGYNAGWDKLSNEDRKKHFEWFEENNIPNTPKNKEDHG